MKKSDNNEVLLKAKKLKKSFKDRLVLDGIDLSLNKGEAVVVLGPSGCGKSTLLRCINGIEKIDSGEIWLREEELTDKNTNWTKVRQKIGMVFQSYELFGHLTILDNILLGPLKVQKRDRKEAEEQATELLKRVGLEDRKNDYPSQLSGGQKQRIAIVRALCMNPELILFDEVTAALDPEMVREVLDVILELAKQGMSMMLVTHEIEFAKAVADQVIFIDNHEIVEVTSGKEFFYQPKSARGQQFLNKFNYKAS